GEMAVEVAQAVADFVGEEKAPDVAAAAIKASGDDKAAEIASAVTLSAGTDAAAKIAAASAKVASPEKAAEIAKKVSATVGPEAAPMITALVITSAGDKYAEEIAQSVTQSSPEAATKIVAAAVVASKKDPATLVAAVAKEAPEASEEIGKSALEAEKNGGELKAQIKALTKEVKKTVKAVEKDTEKAEKIVARQQENAEKLDKVIEKINNNAKETKKLVEETKKVVEEIIEKADQQIEEIKEIVKENKAAQGEQDGEEKDEEVEFTNFRPVFTGAKSQFSIAENSAVGSVVGTVSAKDENKDDKLTYTLTSNAAFSIGSTTGTITVKNSAALDYETQKVWKLTVTASDGKLAGTLSISIKVTDVNENLAPIISNGGAQFLLDENSNSGTLVGSVKASDPNPDDTLDYALSHSAYKVTNSGNIVVKNSRLLNYENITQRASSLSVTVSDSGMLSAQAKYTVKLKDVNEPLTYVQLTNASYSLPYVYRVGMLNNTLVGRFSNDDPDEGDTHKYLLVNASGNSGSGATHGGIFKIVGNALHVVDTLGLEPGNYDIYVKVVSTGNITKLGGPFTIKVGQSTVFPGTQAFPLSEGVDASSILGKLISQFKNTSQQTVSVSELDLIYIVLDKLVTELGSDKISAQNIKLDIQIESDHFTLSFIPYADLLSYLAEKANPLVGSDLLKTFIADYLNSDDGDGYGLVTVTIYPTISGTEIGYDETLSTIRFTSDSLPNVLLSVKDLADFYNDQTSAGSGKIPTTKDFGSFLKGAISEISLGNGVINFIKLCDTSYYTCN
ncbi:cadherin domain-containing protein, partial [Magnetococcales bacterium HHB-1]